MKVRVKNLILDYSNEFIKLVNSIYSRKGVFPYNPLMIILGIDPWTATTGFALLEKEGRVVRVIEYGVITTRAWLSLSERLLQIGNDLRELIDTYHPDEIAAH